MGAKAVLFFVCFGASMVALSVPMFIDDAVLPSCITLGSGLATLFLSSGAGD